MAVFSSSRYLLSFFVLNLYLKVMDADPNLLAFSFKNFGNQSQLALFGDSKVTEDNMSVQLAGSRVSSSGGLICKKPIDLVSSRNMVSFSSYFLFSLSEENGDGLAFVMLPFNFPLNIFDGDSMGMLGDDKLKYLAVEFGTFKDEKHDFGTHVFVEISNVSSVDLIPNSGEKIQAWIDYEASCKKIEVRLSKSGENKPIAPLLSHPIDLSEMWGNENVTVGLSSSSGNSSLFKSTVYSWSFNSWIARPWVHSEPLDPDDRVEKVTNVRVPKRNECGLRIIGALIFGSFVVLYLWSMCGYRRPVVVPEEIVTQTKEFEYDKFRVSTDKIIEDGKK